MSSPDPPAPEWLLFREHYKIQSKDVSHQLESLTRIISPIQEVIPKLANLSAESDVLQAENHAFKEHITSLQENLGQHNELNDRLQADNDKLISRTEHLEQHVNQQSQLNERLQADNVKLTSRMVHLEQDANQQDQINAMNSLAKDDLEEKLAKLKGDHVNVIEAVTMMQETSKIEKEKLNKDWVDMKARIEASLTTSVHRDPSSEGRAPGEFTAPFRPDSGRDRASRELSEATTADESMRLDHEKDTLLDLTHSNALPGTTQLYTQYPEETRLEASNPSDGMAEQGSLSVEEYIKYADEIVVESMTRYEVRAVRTFVSGMKDKYAQHLLTERLNKAGWTWVMAKQELHRMIEDGRKRKRKRRTMPVFDLGEAPTRSGARQEIL